MRRTYRGYDLWRLWWAVTITATSLTVLAAVIFPRQVYDEFIWRYFWGPIVADGRGARCAELADGSVALHHSIEACQAATGIVAEPGYTVVSTVSYALILIFILGGVYVGLERYEFGTEPSLFFALLPFMFLGGTSRVLEDATLAVPDGSSAFVLSFPATALLISPPIYFLMFVVTIVVLAIGVTLERQGKVTAYEYPVLAIGTFLWLASLAYLIYLAMHIPEVTLSIPMFVITIVGATLVTVVIWFATEAYAPSINEGTGIMGAIIIWGHAIDGFANVLSLDWGDALGLGQSYDPKHVVNAFIRDTMEEIQPESVSAVIGDVWPFLILKIGVATLVVWLFDDELFDTSPRFAIVLLIAVFAVGIGPGTRDLLRATLGI